MKLIIDSGSTKTDWVVIGEQGNKQFIKTEGINPIMQDEPTIREIFHKALSQIEADNTAIEIYFYGAGVRKETQEKIIQAAVLSVEDKSLKHNELAISAESDLLGAARALFCNDKGIACILGTGSNSGLYDGQKITDNIPPLGYILGDEGSGAVLGRRFINALYKRRLSGDVTADFEKHFSMTLADTIEAVYRRPMANRFLASLAPFIKEKIENEEIKHLVESHFGEFFENNVRRYRDNFLPIGFVGSIAFNFEKQLRAAAKRYDCQIKTIIQSPLEGLIHYHSAK